MGKSAARAPVAMQQRANAIFVSPTATADGEINRADPEMV